MMFDLDAVAIEIKLILKVFFSILKKNGFSLCYQMDSIFISQKAKTNHFWQILYKEKGIKYSLYLWERLYLNL